MDNNIAVTFACTVATLLTGVYFGVLAGLLTERVLSRA